MGDYDNYRGGFVYTGLLARVRELRQKQTPTEQIFWEFVRNRRFFGMKFRRQHQIGMYIVDFYCHEKRVVVELDGGIHDTPKHVRDDRERDNYFSSLGIFIFHVQNDLFLQTPDRVMQDLAIIFSNRS